MWFETECLLKIVGNIYFMNQARPFYWIWADGPMPFQRLANSRTLHDQWPNGALKSTCTPTLIHEPVTELCYMTTGYLMAVLMGGTPGKCMQVTHGYEGCKSCNCCLLHWLFMIVHTLIRTKALRCQIRIVHLWVSFHIFRFSEISIGIVLLLLITSNT